ncbi:DUF3037 domain-containing protein [Botryobacter ruber]|uniref:DUF3037 domain-containing protein n=1 Tax=Botryobacter ruber TaxID=2171629 RepID=UPI000E0B128E|nr:DUF3037 domain-containing protein [Botryobacter ruber]
MQDKHLFEYAVIRVVPRVEREEFLNVGVILYCAAEGFLQTKCALNEQRLNACFANVDVAELKERLLAFEKVCAGRAQGGPIGQLPIASRFRWLTAARSTIVQTSPVHPGMCNDAKETLEKLYEQLVA